MKKNNYNLLAFLMLMLCLISCQKNGPGSVLLPAITTNEISARMAGNTGIPVVSTSEIEGESTAVGVCRGTIINDGGSQIIESGICWSTSNPEPTKNDRTIAQGADNGNLTVSLKSLTPNSYYIRAYASNAIGTGYSPTVFIVIDYDLNLYHTVFIGKQVWLKENLRVSHTNDGATLIPNVALASTWTNINSKEPMMCWYNNDKNTYKLPYGALYNWYAATKNNIAPSGWHVATITEWQTLANYLGGYNPAGGKLKETGTTHWKSPNLGATNESYFTAVGAGNRINGQFLDLLSIAIFWTSDPINANGQYWRTSVGYDSNIIGPGIFTSETAKHSGFSIRCIKD